MLFGNDRSVCLLQADLLYWSPDVWLFCKLILKYEGVWWAKIERYIFFHLFGYIIILFFIYCHIKRQLKADQINFINLKLIEKCRVYDFKLCKIFWINPRGRKWKILHTSDHVELNYCFVLMLGHCLRRWPNMKPTVGQFFVFTGQRIPVGIQTWNQR